jgi:hypothetical protein
VGRKHHLCRGDPSSDREVDVVSSGDRGDLGQRRERSVTLVQVQHTRLGADERQGVDPSDAQDELLLDPRLEVAAVEARGDLPIPRSVLLDVGVEQVQPRPSDRRGPQLRRDHAAGERQLDGERCAVELAEQGHGEPVRIEHLPHLALRACVVESLVGGLPVEEPDTDERDAQGTRRLELLASDGPEPAREDGERVGQGELRGEVGDAQRWRAAVRRRVPRDRRLVEIVGSVLDDLSR